MERLWHKDLIPYLPQSLLIQQWRDCCIIAKFLAKSGSPPNPIVNRLMDYPINHLFNYALDVTDEFGYRGYKINDESWDKFINNLKSIDIFYNKICTDEDMFCNWHDEKYLLICLAMIEEQYDCGIISDSEFDLICDAFSYVM